MSYTTVILHVGMGKTGTSTIPAFLARNRRQTPPMVVTEAGQVVRGISTIAQQHEFLVRKPMQQDAHQTLGPTDSRGHHAVDA